ncbi:hypothetical protein V8C42DRAFT_273450 [Trichoderma barbatum]
MFLSVLSDNESTKQYHVGHFTISLLPFFRQAFFTFYTIQRILSAFWDFFFPFPYFVFFIVFKDHAHTPSMRGFFTMIPSGRTRQAFKDMTPLHPRFPFVPFFISYLSFSLVVRPLSGFISSAFVSGRVLAPYS